MHSFVSTRRGLARLAGMLRRSRRRPPVSPLDLTEAAPCRLYVAPRDGGQL
jgi:hypothetical protein